MFTCPRCRTLLERTKTRGGLYWQCSNCQGRSATIEFLRRVTPRPVVNEIWQLAKADAAPSGQDCPACDATMRRIQIPGTPDRVDLDVCIRCHCVWFDTSEFEAIPSLPQAPDAGDDMPQAAREKLALLEVEKIRKQAEQESWSEHGPDAGWKVIPALFGLPVECEGPLLSAMPWVTWAVALITTLTSLLAFTDLSTALSVGAFYPGDAFRSYGITLLSSFVLHGGWFHLVSNMYFLLVFGDNVESTLGKWRYGVLLALATITGNLLHAWADPRAVLPCVGASGGISGIIAFYALAFPRTRLGVCLRYGVLIRWFQAPAYALFILWGLLQAIGMHLQVNGIGAVSYASHVGGLLVGLAAWGLMQAREHRESSG